MTDSSETEIRSYKLFKNECHFSHLSVTPALLVGLLVIPPITSFVNRYFKKQPVNRHFFIWQLLIRLKFSTDALFETGYGI